MFWDNWIFFSYQNTLFSMCFVYRQAWGCCDTLAHFVRVLFTCLFSIYVSWRCCCDHWWSSQEDQIWAKINTQFYAYISYPNPLIPAPKCYTNAGSVLVHISALFEPGQQRFLVRFEFGVNRLASHVCTSLKICEVCTHTIMCVRPTESAIYWLICRFCYYTVYQFTAVVLVLLFIMFM